MQARGVAVRRPSVRRPLVAVQGQVAAHSSVAIARRASVLRELVRHLWTRSPLARARAAAEAPFRA